MKNKYTFLDLAEEVLSGSKIKMPMTVQEIWQYAVLKGIDKKLNSCGKTPDKTLGASLYVDVRKRDSIFMEVSKKPTLFWLVSRINELPNEEEIDNFLNNTYSEIEKDNQYKERELHQVLVNYLSNCPLGSIYSKTIFHENSKKGIKGQDKWNYPDMVGVSFIFSEGEYQSITLDFMKLMKYPMFKIFSFELKKTLNFGNYKQSYFQAVSNSSWANEGYLVSVSIDDEVKLEIKRLCDAFGIGLIQLDIENIEESKIIYNSKSKDMVDFATLDLLIGKNNTFANFINNIKYSINAVDAINKTEYDKVLSDDDMKKYLLKLK